MGNINIWAISILIVLFSGISVSSKNLINDTNIEKCLVQIAKGIPTENINIIFDNYTDKEQINVLQSSFQNDKITTTLYNITETINKEKFINFISNEMLIFNKIYCIFFCTHKISGNILIELEKHKLMHRDIVYIFYWGNSPIERYFIRSFNRAMHIVVITSPREGVYRLFYNQATPQKEHHLTLVNWWSLNDGLYHVPSLPSPMSVYNNFNGKILKVPVMHKPPWLFVNFTNETVHVYGGRDAKLLKLLSNKLNFRYIYLNPSNYNTNNSVNASFESALDLIHKREADIFLGDITLTYERNKILDFSYFTLADSGAFITHAPSRLSETLALVRPFQKEVWPLIILTMLISGPILYFLIVIPNLYDRKINLKSRRNLFASCIWFSISIFLKQNGKELVSSHKFRFFTFICIYTTYIINDMYSANLTSLLAKPGREKPINNLFQLENAMRLQKYELYVDQHSSLYNILLNGSGIYGKLWDLMVKQPKFITDSVESGVKLIKNSKKNVLMAGRETLYFDVQRFGSNYFHLGEKLNTAYSAIALQFGCPYIENINKILMTLTETGILLKMTEDEYKNLKKHEPTANDKSTNINDVKLNIEENKQNIKSDTENDKLDPISIKMLQGAFYLLLFGNIFSVIIFLIEISYDHHRNKLKIIMRNIYKKLNKLQKYVFTFFSVVLNRVKQKYRTIKHDMYVSTIEYMK